jgi:Fe(3+) dicitrate transport protein
MLLARRVHVIALAGLSIVGGASFGAGLAQAQTPPPVTPVPTQAPAGSSSEPGAQPAESPAPPPEQAPPDQLPAPTAVSGGDEPLQLRAVVVTYEPPSLLESSGAVQSLNEKQLETFRFNDPQQVLLQVPGVFVRQEDGFGLRPNISIRGVSPERSSKIVLMEDNVLFGPAPYSAPAAYYFPLMMRMVGVEVVKGPAGIVYGPNTVGGAVNLKTREIPDGSKGAVDLALGSYLTGRFHGHYGVSNDWGGLLLEAAHLRSDGFKELDGGGDTGFARTELMLKGALNTDLSKPTFHRLEVKLGYSHELSNETYLGLTDADFRQNPNRRYAASALDQMNWDRIQMELSHEAVVGEHVEVRTTAYRHDFWRVWRRLNNFEGANIADVLRDPTSGQRSVFYDVLTGAQDSSTPAETLLIANNDRDFVSEGIQSVAKFRYDHGDFVHRAEAGLRFHYDEIERDHTEDPYVMQGGELAPEGGPTTTVVRNKGSAFAVAGHVLYGLTYQKLTVTPGVRMELIHTKLQNYLDDTTLENQQNVVLPGAGVHYALTQELGVLAGVHKGFSPTAPGQAQEVNPESSVNYEAGARYKDPATQTHAELIGFFVDYSNLVGECRAASGCDESQIDQQFNGGQVDIYGLEAMASKVQRFTDGFSGRGRLAYTLTQTEFRTSFSSENPQFGDVQKGDHLPYVPLHQGTLQLGAFGPRWSADTLLTYIAPMWETAGQGDAAPDEKTDSFFTVDVVGDYELFRGAHVYARVENIFFEEAIVSRRPFGARPGKPFLAQLGFKYTF